MSLTKLNGVCKVCRIIRQNLLHFDGVRVSWERVAGRGLHIIVVVEGEELLIIL